MWWSSRSSRRCRRRVSALRHRFGPDPRGYRRRLGDLPITGRPVRIEARERRFRYDAPGCKAVTFAEQMTDLTTLFARLTSMLTEHLAAIGLALAGRAGSPLAAKPGIPIGRHTVIRLVRALPEPQARTPNAASNSLRTRPNPRFRPRPRHQPRPIPGTRRLSRPRPGTIRDHLSKPCMTPQCPRPTLR